MKDSKFRIIWVVLGILLFILVILDIIKIVNRDDMNTKGNQKVYYRTYTKEKGWSKWSRNGKTSGNKEYNIQNIQVKVKSKDVGEIFYGLYDGVEWTDGYTINSKIDTKNINGIKINLTDTLYKKNEVCYRTYNINNKWLDWSCAGEINGNKERSIRAIQIKVIPKNVIRNEYLKNYNLIDNKNVGF